METLLFPKPVYYEMITQYNTFLNNFSEMHWEDIQCIWILPNENKITSIYDIKYSPDAPLYQKMILRFYNCRQSPSIFFSSIDPCNKRKLLSYYTGTDKECNDLAYFFVWLKGNFGRYEIIKLSNKLGVDPAELHNDWINYNEIVFFLALPAFGQKIIINTYYKFVKDTQTLHGF